MPGPSSGGATLPPCAPKPAKAPSDEPTQRALIRRTREQAEMAELCRRLEFAGPIANFELILENLKRALGYVS